MSNEKTVEAEISGYISTVLRKYFGKGPTSVYVTFKHPFISIHFRGFLSAPEKLLMKQDEEKRVLETRNLVMMDLKPEMMRGIKEVVGLQINELYADWDLQKETGIFIGVLNGEVKEEDFEWTDAAVEQNFRERIEEASRKSEKVPGYTQAYWLSNRAILVRRNGVLVEIEKELIKNGYVEELRLTKRPLEQRMLKEAQLETILNRTISETFLDWNFEEDKSYTVFLLEPEAR